MAVNSSDLPDMFSYHQPEGDQPQKYQKLRESAQAFAASILTNTPTSADQTAAIRLVRQALMTANAAIATGGKY